jgi:Domain of unknown function (DUF4260)
VRIAVADVAVELDEAPRVEELLDPLAGEELPAGALALDGALVTGMERLVAAALQLVELRLGALVRVGRHGLYLPSESRRMRMSMPSALLRLEGLAVLGAALALYVDGPYALWALLVFFLAPDLSFFGYLGGARVGAVVYNAAHTYVGPVGLGAAAAVAGGGLGVQVALIWGAHIGLDRFLGYGLKYPSGFKDTHLGRV